VDVELESTNDLARDYSAPDWQERRENKKKEDYKIDDLRSLSEGRKRERRLLKGEDSTKEGEERKKSEKLFLKIVMIKENLGLPWGRQEKRFEGRGSLAKGENPLGNSVLRLLSGGEVIRREGKHYRKFYGPPFLDNGSGRDAL